jgi:hypothetical protein
VARLVIALFVGNVLWSAAVLLIAHDRVRLIADDEITRTMAARPRKTWTAGMRQDGNSTAAIGLKVVLALRRALPIVWAASAALVVVVVIYNAIV